LYFTSEGIIYCSTARSGTPQLDCYSIFSSRHDEATKFQNWTNDNYLLPTTQTTTMDAVEEIRLQEMYGLSQPERDRIQEEVHGVYSMAVEETASLLSQKYQQFDACLQQMPDKPAAYEWALQHPDECHYVLHNRNFHVMFLRADLFDVSKAVQRYCRNIQVLFKYFGVKALQRPLRYTDLKKGEIEVLKAGMIQILPSRDRAGRLIVVVLGASKHPKHQYVRILYFFCFGLD
jgi:hypothetical protein